MLYQLHNGKFVPVSHVTGTDACIYVTDYKGATAACQDFSLPENVAREIMTSRSAKLESHNGYDLICLHRLNPKDILSESEHIIVYLKKDLMLIVCDEPGFIQSLLSSGSDCHSSGAAAGYDSVLCNLLMYLTRDDAVRLEDMEDEIAGLEDALLTSQKQDCVREISSLRRRLLVLKRYYEQLLDILDAIAENENGVIDKRSMRFFKIFSGRIDRLYHSVLNLRDYVTQVRESYQAAVDISLNSIMKFFTVITSIFLPLSLIAGWYGMNFQGMPEYSWSLGYPAVIFISAAVVLWCIIYFKKNKWF